MKGAGAQGGTADFRLLLPGVFDTIHAAGLIYF